MPWEVPSCSPPYNPFISISSFIGILENNWKLWLLELVRRGQKDTYNKVINSLLAIIIISVCLSVSLFLYISIYQFIYLYWAMHFPYLYFSAKSLHFFIFALRFAGKAFSQAVLILVLHFLSVSMETKILIIFHTYVHLNKPICSHCK